MTTRLNDDKEWSVSSRATTRLGRQTMSSAVAFCYQSQPRLCGPALRQSPAQSVPGFRPLVFEPASQFSARRIRSHASSVLLTPCPFQHTSIYIRTLEPFAHVCGWHRRGEARVRVRRKCEGGQLRGRWQNGSGVGGWVGGDATVSCKRFKFRKTCKAVPSCVCTYTARCPIISHVTSCGIKTDLATCNR